MPYDVSLINCLYDQLLKLLEVVHARVEALCPLKICLSTMSRKGYCNPYRVTDEVNVLKIKSISEPLQNRKCLGCKFCLYDYDCQGYKCTIRGCYENSKYVEYAPDFNNKRIV